MLCRTASDLFWLARNVERAENTARLLDLTQRMALLPERLDPGRSDAASWHRALQALGLEEQYAEAHGVVEADQVLHYAILGAANPSSILNCLRSAREAGRAQRGAITTEMYQDLNGSWLEISALAWEQVRSDGVSPFLEWVKGRSASFRGITLGTMGRDEGYNFMRLGTFVERADNTVRLLDIKYAASDESEVHEVRNFLQYYQWSALLQAISAFDSYRKIYRDTVTPVRVAELLIFREDMPRSLATCCGALHNILKTLADNPRIDAVRLAGSLAAEIRYGCIDDVLATGMQKFLAQFMSRIENLTDEIVRQFMTSTDLVAA